jgi:hypothetical protein
MRLAWYFATVMSHFALFPLNRKSAAVACAPEEIPASYTLIESLVGVDSLPFDLTLKNVTFGRNGSKTADDLSDLKYLWFDYQLNSLAWPVLSAKLRTIIDHQASGRAHYDWISVNIHRGKEETRPYYILRFKEQPNVLDREKSTFLRVANQPDQLIKPTFSQEKIADLCVFTCPSMFWQIGAGLYVNKAIRDCAKREKLVGLHFESISIC